MKIPRLSLRELLMLTTIVALLVPHLYSRALTANRVDLSYDTIRELVASIDPAARLLSGIGGREFADFTYQVPTGNSDDFFAELHTAVEKHIDQSGWRRNNVGGPDRTNGLVSGFSFELQHDSSRCKVLGMVVDRKSGKDLLHGTDVVEVRFIVFSPHFP